MINGRPYWYLREMEWVGGKAKLASERYLGTAAEVEALLESREQAMVPQRTRVLAFGDVGAAAGRARCDRRGGRVTPFGRRRQRSSSGRRADQ